MSDLSYLKKFTIFFLSWIFGFKWILIGYQTIITYNYPSNNNLIASFFILNWIMNGFIGASTQLIITLTYIMLYYQNYTIELYMTINNHVKNIINKSDEDKSNEDKQILSYYNILDNTIKMITDKIDYLKTSFLVNKSFEWINSISQYVKQKNIQSYLETINSMLTSIVNKIWKLLMKQPHINATYENITKLYNTELHQNNQDNQDNTISTKDEPISNKMTNDLKSFDAFMSSMDNKISPENEMNQLGDMVKLLGNMEKMIGYININKNTTDVTKVTGEKDD
jgi:hypothetical protein